MTDARRKLAAVAIGRNEGARLIDCLASLQGRVGTLVYVDSGSTDGSIAAAEAAGAVMVTLDLSRPFTAARARNAGYAAAIDAAPDTQFVQFLDGDCTLADGWVSAALATFSQAPDLAIVCGRRREKFPDATIWNRMIDREWDSPVGKTRACGGDALVRRSAFEDVSGYREDLIAGEEPEMCFRMRAKGWHIRRIAAEMTRHDADMTRFSQWWQRARRAGHTYAEGAALHGKSPERYRVGEARRTVIWGMVLPVVTLLAMLFLGGWGLVLLLVWPLQMLRLKRRGLPWLEAIFLPIGKLAEAQGALGYWIGRLRGRRHTLIEYK